VENGLGVAPDARCDFEQIALLQMRIETLDRERAPIISFRQLPENANQRRHAVAGNLACAVIQQLSRNAGHILKMNVVNLAIVNQIEIFELTEARPEVIAV